MDTTCVGFINSSAYSFGGLRFNVYEQNMNERYFPSSFLDKLLNRFSILAGLLCALFFILHVPSDIQ